MKTSLVILTLAGLLSIAGIESCTSADKKTEVKVKDPLVYNPETPTSRTGCLEEIKRYKLEVDNIIALNNRSISECDKMIRAANIVYKNSDTKKIAQLEKRNADLKMLVASYRAEGLENCELFEAEFRYEMKELENAFKNQNPMSTNILTLN